MFYIYTDIRQSGRKQYPDNQQNKSRTNCNAKIHKVENTHREFEFRLRRKKYLFKKNQLMSVHNGIGIFLSPVIPRSIPDGLALNN